ncbi:MORN repeat-containing protein [Psychroflexus planctonicus]|uniref:MORN repeat-containing protein n=1 Tax=Psychroflexus planctonicus TaxID=1526575 RepID=A0ABQ1SIG4_9FLAO|nr:hypothetical protein [Psychroflexus planctonicus]GGE41701.1 hypothetical protein GCM10010832_22160 [Psychroflexus planctonicus]
MMMNTSSKKRKNIYKVLFFIILAGFVGVSMIFITSKNKNTKPSDEILEIKQELKSINQNNQTLLAILAADDLLISRTNPQKALEQYQAIFDDAEGQLQNSISSRIKYTQEIINSEEDDEITKINLRSQLANQQDEIDSITRYVDSLKRSELVQNTLKTKQIDSLQQNLTQQKKELARNQAKQVISFSNENGNLIHYLGEVKSGKANGGGIGIWNTGSIYKGEWKDNMRHGKGEFKWADGQVYEGEFKNDMRSGKGTYYWPSGEKYVGEFANNRMNGKGTLFDPDGNKEYEGEWKNDKPKQ